MTKHKSKNLLIKFVHANVLRPFLALPIELLMLCSSVYSCIWKKKIKIAKQRLEYFSFFCHLMQCLLIGGHHYFLVYTKKERKKLKTVGYTQRLLIHKASISDNQITLRLKNKRVFLSWCVCVHVIETEIVRNKRCTGGEDCIMISNCFDTEV